MPDARSNKMDPAFERARVQAMITILGFSNLLLNSDIAQHLEIAQNKTAKEIAEVCNISNRTVEKHKENIIKKLPIGSHYNNLLIWARENQDAIT